MRQKQFVGGIQKEVRFSMAIREPVAVPGQLRRLKQEANVVSGNALEGQEESGLSFRKQSFGLFPAFVCLAGTRCRNNQNPFRSKQVTPVRLPAKAHGLIGL